MSYLTEEEEVKTVNISKLKLTLDDDDDDDGYSKSSNYEGLKKDSRYGKPNISGKPKELSQIRDSQEIEETSRGSDSQSSKADPKKKKILLNTISTVYEDLQKTNEELESLNKNLFSYINKMIDTQKTLVVGDPKSSVGIESSNQVLPVEKTSNLSNSEVDKSKTDTKGTSGFKYFRPFVDSSDSVCDNDEKDSAICEDKGSCIPVVEISSRPPFNESEQTNLVIDQGLPPNLVNYEESRDTCSYYETRKVYIRDEPHAPNYSSYAEKKQDYDVPGSYQLPYSNPFNSSDDRNYQNYEQNPNYPWNVDCTRARITSVTSHDEEYYQNYYRRSTGSTSYAPDTRDHPSVSSNVIICTDATEAFVEQKVDSQCYSRGEISESSNYAHSCSSHASEGKIESTENTKEIVQDTIAQNIIKRYGEYKRNITPTFDKKTQKFRDSSKGFESKAEKTDETETQSRSESRSRLTYGEYKRKMRSGMSDQRSQTTNLKTPLQDNATKTKEDSMKVANSGERDVGSNFNRGISERNNDVGKSSSNTQYSGKIRDDFRGRPFNKSEPSNYNPPNTNKKVLPEREDMKKAFERTSGRRDAECLSVSSTATHNTAKERKPPYSGINESPREQKEVTNRPGSGWTPQTSRYGRRPDRNEQKTTESSFNPYSPFNPNRGADAIQEENAVKSERVESSFKKAPVKERDPAEILSSILKNRENRKERDKKRHVAKATTKDLESSKNNDKKVTSDKSKLSGLKAKLDPISEPIVSSTDDFVESAVSKKDLLSSKISEPKPSDLADSGASVETTESVSVITDSKNDILSTNKDVIVDIKSSDENLVTDDSTNLSKINSEVGEKESVKYDMSVTHTSQTKQLVEDKTGDVQSLETPTESDSNNEYTTTAKEREIFLENESKLMYDREKSRILNNQCVCKVKVVDIFWKEKRDGKFKPKYFRRLIRKYLKRLRRKEQSNSGEIGRDSVNVLLHDKLKVREVKVSSAAESSVPNEFSNKSLAVNSGHEDDGRQPESNKTAQIVEGKKKKKRILSTDSEDNIESNEDVKTDQPMEESKVLKAESEETSKPLSSDEIKLLSLTVHSDEVATKNDQCSLEQPKNSGDVDLQICKQDDGPVLSDTSMQIDENASPNVQSAHEQPESSGEIDLKNTKRHEEPCILEPDLQIDEGTSKTDLCSLEETENSPKCDLQSSKHDVEEPCVSKPVMQTNEDASKNDQCSFDQPKNSGDVDFQSDENKSLNVQSALKQPENSGETDVKNSKSHEEPSVLETNLQIDEGASKTVFCSLEQPEDSLKSDLQSGKRDDELCVSKTSLQTCEDPSKNDQCSLEQPKNSAGVHLQICNRDDGTVLSDTSMQIDKNSSHNDQNIHELPENTGETDLMNTKSHDEPCILEKNVQIDEGASKTSQCSLVQPENSKSDLQSSKHDDKEPCVSKPSMQTNEDASENDQCVLQQPDNSGKTDSQNDEDATMNEESVLKKSEDFTETDRVTIMNDKVDSTVNNPDYGNISANNDSGVISLLPASGVSSSSCVPEFESDTSKMSKSINKTDGKLTCSLDNPADDQFDSTDGLLFHNFESSKDSQGNRDSEAELSTTEPLPIIENVSNEIDKSLLELEQVPNTLIEASSDSSEEEEVPFLKNLSSFLTDLSKISQAGESISSYVPSGDQKDESNAPNKNEINSSQERLPEVKDLDAKTNVADTLNVDLSCRDNEESQNRAADQDCELPSCSYDVVSSSSEKIHEDIHEEGTILEHVENPKNDSKVSKIVKTKAELKDMNSAVSRYESSELTEVSEGFVVKTPETKSESLIALSKKNDSEGKADSSSRIKSEKSVESKLKISEIIRSETCRDKKKKHKSQKKERNVDSRTVLHKHENKKNKNTNLSGSDNDSAMENRKRQKSLYSNKSNEEVKAVTKEKSKNIRCKEQSEKNIKKEHKHSGGIRGDSLSSVDITKEEKAIVSEKCKDSVSKLEADTITVKDKNSKGIRRDSESSEKREERKTKKVKSFDSSDEFDSNLGSKRDKTEKSIKKIKTLISESDSSDKETKRKHESESGMNIDEVKEESFSEEITKKEKAIEGEKCKDSGSELEADTTITAKHKNSKKIRRASHSSEKRKERKTKKVKSFDSSDESDSDLGSKKDKTEMSVKKLKTLVSESDSSDKETKRKHESESGMNIDEVKEKSGSEEITESEKAYKSKAVKDRGFKVEAGTSVKAKHKRIKGIHRDSESSKKNYLKIVTKVKSFDESDSDSGDNKSDKSIKNIKTLVSESDSSGSETVRKLESGSGMEVDEKKEKSSSEEIIEDEKSRSCEKDVSCDSENEISVKPKPRITEDSYHEIFGLKTVKIVVEKINFTESNNKEQTQINDSDNDDVASEDYSDEKTESQSRTESAMKIDERENSSDVESTVEMKTINRDTISRSSSDSEPRVKKVKHRRSSGSRHHSEKIKRRKAAELKRIDLSDEESSDVKKVSKHSKPKSKQKSWLSKSIRDSGIKTKKIDESESRKKIDYDEGSSSNDEISFHKDYDNSDDDAHGCSSGRDDDHNKMIKRGKLKKRKRVESSDNNSETSLDEETDKSRKPKNTLKTDVKVRNDDSDAETVKKNEYECTINTDEDRGNSSSKEVVSLKEKRTIPVSEDIDDGNSDAGRNKELESSRVSTFEESSGNSRKRIHSPVIEKPDLKTPKFSETGDKRGSITQNVSEIEGHPDSKTPKVSETDDKWDSITQKVSEIEDNPDLETQKVSEIEVDADSKTPKFSEIEVDVDSRTPKVSEIEIDPNSKTPEDSEIEVVPESKTPKVSDIEVDPDSRTQKVSEIKDFDPSKPSCSFEPSCESVVETLYSKDSDIFTCFVCQKQYCSNKQKGTELGNYSEKVSEFCSPCFINLYKDRYISFKRKLKRKLKKTEKH